MPVPQKPHFLLDVMDWAEKRPKGFLKDELLSYRNFEEWELLILNGYFENATTNHRRKGLPNFTYLPETIFQIIKDEQGEKFILTPDALFKHIDAEELKLARENAKQARNFSFIAISISILAAIISAVVPWWIASSVSQTVKIDDRQLELLSLQINEKTK